MTKHLKLIWFAEKSWTKYHAAVGINAEQTICGVIRRSAWQILPSEKAEFIRVGHTAQPVMPKCSRCLAALRKRYGHEDVVEVKVG